MQTVQKSLMILPDLKDRVALITGAGSGIGRAAAVLLAQQGMKVCLVDLNDDRLEQTKTRDRINRRPSYDGRHRYLRSEPS